jgi:hypothetical protein
MTNVRNQLAVLASDAGKEIVRLAQLESVYARDELRWRVWPFLLELVEALQSSDGNNADERAPTISVDLVARTVCLLVWMGARLGKQVPRSEMDSMGMVAAEVTKDLIALCDPDELAAWKPAAAMHTDEALPIAPALDAMLGGEEPQLESELSGEEPHQS